MEEMQWSSRCFRMSAGTYRWCYISSPSAPAAPNPTATAQAQTASNEQTALYQAGLNDTNQNTPYGSETYQIGTQNIDGTNVPQTTATTTLSPQVQTDLNYYLQTAGNEGAIGSAYQNQVANTLSQPLQEPNVPTANQGLFNQTVQSQEAALQPEINMQTEQNQAQLANEGITPGSQAYNNQMYTFNQGQNNLQEQILSNAENQMAQNYGDLLAGTQQQATENQTAYQEPLNELSALQSGTQVSTPSFNAAPATNVANTNTAGITNQAYQDQLGLYNSQTASNNSLMNSLFGLGGSLGGGYLAASDIRLKKNILRISTHRRGFGIYEFEYLWSPIKHIGVMAQEVRKVLPRAVLDFGGLLAVDYGAL